MVSGAGKSPFSLAAMAEKTLDFAHLGKAAENFVLSRSTEVSWLAKVASWLHLKSSINCKALLRIGSVSFGEQPGVK